MTPRPSHKPWKKSKRRKLQDAHIAAFNGLASRPQPVQIPFVDAQGNTRNIQVNLKLSTIGVPVNGWSGTIGRVGLGGHASSVWGHLESTNQQGLRNLIGDIGNPSNGIAGSARGTRVGGMIGSVMTRLDTEIAAGGGNPRRLADLKRLRADLQESADIVRDLYCAGDHKRNDGDRYKFAMAVLFADSLAKQAHTLLGDSAQGSGFGASQGCMSNKDRGGNADGYLKALHLASRDAFRLLRHSSGSVNPHELVSMLSELPPEDAKNLLVLGLLSSGQQEAQQIQTMVMGSKNATDLMAAITADPVALEMLAGLGRDAKA
jgi:hypothetical protein